MLERYHNKLSDGERAIQNAIQRVREAIQKEVKNVEREYQKRKRVIERGYARATRTVKEELRKVGEVALDDTQKKKQVGDTCLERRRAARSEHTQAMGTCQDILRESLYHVRDVLLWKNAYA